MPHLRRRARTAAALAAALAAGAAALTAAPAGAATPKPDPALASLPQVASGERPGPPVLYSPPPAAPQLQHRDKRFKAPPILVSGQEAYVAGEYLYQDHLYDDYGADTDGQGASSLSERVGDLDHPPGLTGNDADLVELRIARRTDKHVYRITLNAMAAVDTAITTIAFDTDGDPSTGSSTLARDPGAPFPGTDQSITTWGTGAEHTAYAPDGTPTTRPLVVKADLEARQITVVVPRYLSNPGSATWRMTVAVGRRDPATGGWVRPAPTTTGARPSGIYNVGPRFDEPYVRENTPPDTAQAAALRDLAPTRFQHPVDFGALVSGATRSSVPTSGTIIPIFASRLDTGQGRDLSRFPAYKGQLQPYALYVPTAAADGQRHGLTLALHSLGQQHWQYDGSLGVLQIGEQRGSYVATPLGRGPDGWYQREAEVDVFEVWNDVARRFRLDPDRAAVSGYSMGGYGTYRLGGLHPDLFGRAFSTVGPPGDGIWVPPGEPSGGAETNSNRWLENTRHLPHLNLAAGADELVPVIGPTTQNAGNPAVPATTSFEELGYRYRYRVYPAAEHFTIAVADYDVEDAVAFLGDALVDRQPPRVTFSYVPTSDAPDLGLVHDHAYWVADVVVAAPGTRSAPGKGTVDVRSHAAGLGDPAVLDRTPAGGVDPLPYTEVGQDWGPAPAIPAENRLTATLTGVTGATLDLGRGGIDTASPVLVDVTTTVASRLLLAGAFEEPQVVGAPFEVVPEGVVLLLEPGTTSVVVTDTGVPPVVPEAPAALLPAAALAAAALALHRRRRRPA